jgi:hypothetical protein
MLELASTQAFEPSDSVKAITHDPTRLRLAVCSHHGHITLYNLEKSGKRLSA